MELHSMHQSRDRCQASGLTITSIHSMEGRCNVRYFDCEVEYN